MNEDIFAKRLTQRLQQGLEGLPPHVQAGLQSARRQALAAAQGGPAAGAAGAWSWLRMAVPVVAVIAALVVVSVWQNLERSDTGEIDAGLLAGDLPINAYLDDRIDSWSKRSSQ